MQFYLLWGLHDITEILLKVALNKHHILLHYKGRLSHLLIPFPNFDKFFLENITEDVSTSLGLMFIVSFWSSTQTYTF
jgi:hypothetical protein